MSTAPSMRRAGLGLLLLLAPGATAGAAAPTPDVFLGYSYTHAGEASLHGWQVDGSYPLGRSLRLVVDLSGHYGSFAGADLSQLTLLAGARWTWARGRLLPFAEALLGGSRTKTKVTLAGGSLSDSDADGGLALGGGIDWRVAGPWAARARFDLVVLRAEGTWQGDPRLSLGVVYRFGR